MVKLGMLNSRLKDFYDVWLLARQFDFDGPTLASAIEKTFAHRGTAMAAQPAAFSPAFVTAKNAQWQAFVRKSRLADAPNNFAEVVETLATFLAPAAAALGDRRPFEPAWRAPGPWAT
jgi:hypothetical protein